MSRLDEVMGLLSEEDRALVVDVGVEATRDGFNVKATAAVEALRSILASVLGRLREAEEHIERWCKCETNPNTGHKMPHPDCLFHGMELVNPDDGGAP